MNIKYQYQYNQGISRYKLLSANAGVGSIITSNIGYYILVSDVGQWEFIKASNIRIKDIVNDTQVLPEERYKKARKEILDNLGIEFVDDERFIELLKRDKELPALLCLAAIPHLSLNENFNSINIKDNPIIKRLKSKGVEKKPQDFTIPGTHFPKWFRNEKGVLKQYNEWKKDWLSAGKDLQEFAPPRDVSSPFKKRSSKGENIEYFPELTQLNLILICENGHLSDIPWSHYLRWRTTHRSEKGHGERLFIDIGPCCDNPDLKWTENKNRSEGYGSIFIECKNKGCLMGSGSSSNLPKISLQGINNLAPYCPGHKPWEIPLTFDKEQVPYDKDCCSNGNKTQMQVALVTGNSIYFANTFSSVYIPMARVRGIDEDMQRMLTLCEARYTQIGDAELTRQEYADRKLDRLFLKENGLTVNDENAFLDQLKRLFVEAGSAPDVEGDPHELYRVQEYKVFINPSDCYEEGLLIESMTLSPSLSRYFKSIKKVEELKVTSVQLDFTRVRPNERLRDQDGNIVKGSGKNIFSGPNDQVYILPAVENYGEGIFFEFNEEAINQWMNTYSSSLASKIQMLLPRPGNFNGNVLRQKIERNNVKFLLIHTFSHLIMRELEFTCGYPTASLKERLYISPEMSGVLIYTAEGSEGSMGGLIWQAQTEKMEQLIRNALQRAVYCSSDPLCWDSDGQGVFEMNLAACFSCTLVSETACEEWNLGLDRRTAIDPEIGFFASYGK